MFFCDGELTRQEVSYTASGNGYHLIIDNVWAWTCDQCGEPLFDQDVVDTVQEMLLEVDRRLERLTLAKAA